MGLLKIYRVKDWAHLLGLPLLGYFLPRTTLSPHLLATLTASSLLLAYAFSLNDFFDKRINKKEIILPLIPIFLLVPFWFYFKLVGKILILIFFLISTTYSLPKMRFKSVPFICSLWNAFGFSVLFLLGINQISEESLTLFLILFFLLLIAQLIHEIAHQEEDKHTNTRTTALFLGERKTKQICCIGLIITSLISFFFNAAIAILISIYSVYFLILTWKKEGKKLREEYRKFGIIVGIIILVYLIIR